jgi:D-alanyl-D-alanine carboxypeptidase
MLVAALNQAGVDIRSVVEGSCASTRSSWNIKHSSPPLASLMNHTLQERCFQLRWFLTPFMLILQLSCSDNLYAELWLQTLASQSQHPNRAADSSYSTLPTRDAALQHVRALLLDMGLDADLFHQKDGRLHRAPHPAVSS